MLFFSSYWKIKATKLFRTKCIKNVKKNYPKSRAKSVNVRRLQFNLTTWEETSKLLSLSLFLCLSLTFSTQRQSIFDKHKTLGSTSK